MILKYGFSKGLVFIYGATMSETARQLITDVRNEDIWAEFVDGIQAIYEHHTDDPDDRQAALVRLVDAMYPALLNEPALQQAMTQCPPAGEHTTPSWWRSLHEDMTSQITLVAVYHGQAMPLHDHPGSRGLSLVLSGSAHIRYADIAEVDQASGIVQIVMADSQECSEKGVSSFDTDHNNLHSIEAMTPYAQVLVVHTPPIKREEQAFYFPLLAKHWLPGQQLRAKRIKIRNHFGH